MKTVAMGVDTPLDWVFSVFSVFSVCCGGFSQFSQFRFSQFSSAGFLNFLSFLYIKWGDDHGWTTESAQLILDLSKLQHILTLSETNMICIVTCRLRYGLRTCGEPWVNKVLPQCSRPLAQWGKTTSLKRPPAMSSHHHFRTTSWGSMRQYNFTSTQCAYWPQYGIQIILAAILPSTLNIKLNKILRKTKLKYNTPVDHHSWNQMIWLLRLCPAIIWCTCSKSWNVLTILYSLVYDFQKTHLKQLNFARACKHPHLLDLYVGRSKLRL